VKTLKSVRIEVGGIVALAPELRQENKSEYAENCKSKNMANTDTLAPNLHQEDKVMVLKI